MTGSFRIRSGVFLTLGLGAATLAPLFAAQHAPLPLAVDTVRVTIQGTSNIHDYAASSTAATLVKARVARPVASDGFWTEIARPGELQEFEIAVRAASLHSDKDDLDKNMHKALKAEQFPDITFRLSRIETAANGAQKAIGVLRIAGVERQVSFDITLERRGAGLAANGRTQLLMTDFGIAAPRAMLGMLRTDPKVTITFETLLSIPAV